DVGAGKDLLLDLPVQHAAQLPGPAVDPPGQRHRLPYRRQVGRRFRAVAPVVEVPEVDGRSVGRIGRAQPYRPAAVAGVALEPGPGEVVVVAGGVRGEAGRVPVEPYRRAEDEDVRTVRPRRPVLDPGHDPVGRVRGLRVAVPPGPQARVARGA